VTGPVRASTGDLGHRVGGSVTLLLVPGPRLVSEASIDGALRPTPEGDAGAVGVREGLVMEVGADEVGLGGEEGQLFRGEGDVAGAGGQGGFEARGGVDGFGEVGG
jgi:hypothetical protein